MSGHSKFANIKHKKEKNDAAKGKIFTIIGREIAVAVKEGGADPNNNSKLRDVIAKAKANNMPNDTIERGIKKAAGDLGSVNYENNTYEGYGPSGVAIIVETLTDNKNRTAANVRSAFTKGNGSIGTTGCVSFMFDKKGQIIIDKEECDMDADDLMMLALDAGAEDFVEEEDDDYYSSNTLEKVASIYSSLNNDYVVIIGDMERVSSSGDLIHRYHFSQEMVDRKSCFGHPSMFAAKAVYDKIGLYDVSYSLAADGEWQYRAMEDEDITFVLEPTVFNHMREGGASDNPKYRWKWFAERSRMQINHNRGSKVKIYASELKKVIITDIKHFLPQRLESVAYRLKYKRQEFRNGIK